MVEGLARDVDWHKEGRARDVEGREVDPTTRGGRLHQLNGLKKAASLRKYFSEDLKLQEICSVFSQRFTAMGTKKSYTMSTLADLTWTVACEVAEAMNEGRVPGVASAEEVADLHRQNLILLRSLERCRLDYSKELFEMRDRLRNLGEIQTASGPVDAASAIAEQTAEIGKVLGIKLFS